MKRYVQTFCALRKRFCTPNGLVEFQPVWNSFYLDCEFNQIDDDMFLKMWNDHVKYNSVLQELKTNSLLMKFEKSSSCYAIQVSKNVVKLSSGYSVTRSSFLRVFKFITSYQKVENEEISLL